MSTSLSLLDPRFKPYAELLLEVARQSGLKPRVTSTFRSVREQAQLYDRYLRGQSNYPVAEPGLSMHNYGLAIDLTSEANEWLGMVWKSWGGQWSPSDSVHFSV